MSKGRDFLNRHVQYLLSGDTEGMMQNHYTEDCELVTFEFTLKGRKAVGQYLGVDEPKQAGKCQLQRRSPELSKPRKM